MRSLPKLVSAPLALLVAVAAGCGGSPSDRAGDDPPSPSTQGRPAAVKQVTNVYAATKRGMLTPVTRRIPFRIYVPNSESNTVNVIDPKRKRVIRTFAVASLPQHVVPSPDLRTLYVNSNQGNSLLRIDAKTARPTGRPIPVEDPYNLYFTIDGKTAIVMAERLMRIDFRDAKTMRLEKSVPVPCQGINHLDFSADGRTFVASCEFAGALIKVDVQRRKLVRRLSLPRMGMPQDVKLSPDGKRYYVADMRSNGVWVVDADRLRIKRFIPTGRGAHGLYPSRDARYLYVSNRGEGTISVLDFATGREEEKWRIPGGGSPDMGGVSPDGRELWLSGRYSGEVYAFDTRTGKLAARIKVGNGPHGMAVWPQPGRVSLGHTGNTR
jgi:YVTN family beta-propeller protein